MEELHEAVARYSVARAHLQPRYLKATIVRLQDLPAIAIDDHTLFIQFRMLHKLLKFSMCSRPCSFLVGRATSHDMQKMVLDQSRARPSIASEVRKQQCMYFVHYDDYVQIMHFQLMTSLRMLHYIRNAKTSQTADRIVTR